MARVRVELWLGSRLSRARARLWHDFTHNEYLSDANAGSLVAESWYDSVKVVNQNKLLLKKFVWSGHVHRRPANVQDLDFATDNCEQGTVGTGSLSEGELANLRLNSIVLGAVGQRSGLVASVFNASSMRPQID